MIKQSPSANSDKGLEACTKDGFENKTYLMEWIMQSSQAASQRDIEDVLNIFESGFGHPGWSSEGVQQRFKASTVSGFLEDASGQRLGYAFYSIPKSGFRGTHILWEDAICIRKDIQRERLGSPAKLWPVAWQAVRAQFPGETVGWIGGRTQNPAVIQRYWSQAARDVIYPFRESYGSDIGKELAALLRIGIPELEGLPIPPDGILRGIYGGRLGDYTVAPKPSRIEDWLFAHDFNRDAGDAVVVIAQLDSPMKINTPANGSRPDSSSREVPDN